MRDINPMIWKRWQNDEIVHPVKKDKANHLWSPN